MRERARRQFECDNSVMQKTVQMKIVTVKSYIFGLGRFDLAGFSLTQFKSMPISYPGWIISVIHT